MLRLIHGLQPDHELAVACPTDGPLAGQIEALGLMRYVLPTVQLSLKLSGTQTGRGVMQMLASGTALSRAARQHRADVIHANTIRTGLIAALAPGRPPVVVRAHEHPPASNVGRAVRSVIVHSSAAVAAVSDYTASHFNEGLSRRAAVRVYNSVDHERLNPDRTVPARLREELSISPDAALIGHVAQITPWKNQLTSIRALAMLRARGVDAHLVIVGKAAFVGKGVRYDNLAYQQELETVAADLGVTAEVHFVGHRPDVPEVLAACGISLLPSWEEPFGLATVESMAMGVPPIVSAVGAGPELVEDGVCGRVLPPLQPEAWARAAGELLADRSALDWMGRRCREFAAHFQDEVQAREMVAVLDHAVTRVGSAPWVRSGRVRPIPA